MPRPSKADRAASRELTKKIVEEESDSPAEDNVSMQDQVMQLLQDPSLLQQYFQGEGEGGEGEDGESIWDRLNMLFSSGEGEEGEGEGEGEDGGDFAFDFGGQSAAVSPFSFDFSAENFTFGATPQPAAGGDPDDIDDEVTTKKIDPKTVTKESSPLQKKAQGLDYYAILGVEQTAPIEAITKAYKRLSLQHHPDRHMGDKKQEKEFAYLSRIYQTLIDQRKRLFYDKHGESSGNDLSDGFLDAYEHWKQTFPQITPDDTEAFKAQYLDSEEEKQDVITAFNKCKGDLYKMMKDELFFSSPATYERDVALVKTLIGDKAITNSKFIEHFNKTHQNAQSKLQQHHDQEKKQFEELTSQATKIATEKLQGKKKPSQKDIDHELSILIMKNNRDAATPDENVLENIALQMAKASNLEDEDKKPVASKRKRASSPPPKTQEKPAVSKSSKRVKK